MSMVLERTETLKDLAKHGPQGSVCLDHMKDIIKKFDNSKARNFLEKIMCTEPVVWEQVKAIWPTPKEQEDNRFSFVQGDLIISNLVKLPGQGQMSQSHTRWVVISPTCDTVREKFIRVAPAFEVRSFFKDGTDDQKEDYENFNKAIKLLSRSNFPYIPFAEEKDKDLLGYYVDLSTPGYLVGDDKESAAAHYSLSIEGWNLLNMHIQRYLTRATVSEETQFRSSRVDETDYSVLATHEKCDLVKIKKEKNTLIRNRLEAAFVDVDNVYKSLISDYGKIESHLQKSKFTAEEDEVLHEAAMSIHAHDKHLVSKYLTARDTIKL